VQAAVIRVQGYLHDRLARPDQPSRDSLAC
jgi:hypothetical protein